VNQVRQRILAEKLRFQSFWLTEHHFQPKGAEMSPNPLMVQMSVAAHTKRIRLRQAANIIVWYHPVRLAPQIATLDVIGGGRVERALAAAISPRRRNARPPGRLDDPVPPKNTVDSDLDYRRERIGLVCRARGTSPPRTQVSHDVDSSPTPTDTYCQIQVSGTGDPRDIRADSNSTLFHANADNSQTFLSRALKPISDGCRGSRPAAPNPEWRCRSRRRRGFCARWAFPGASLLRPISIPDRLI